MMGEFGSGSNEKGAICQIDERVERSEDVYRVVCGRWEDVIALPPSSP